MNADAGYGSALPWVSFRDGTLVLEKMGVNVTQTRGDVAVNCRRRHEKATRTSFVHF